MNNDQLGPLVRRLAPPVDDWTRSGAEARGHNLLNQRVDVTRRIVMADTARVRHLSLKRWTIAGLAGVLLIAGTASATAATLNASSRQNRDARRISSVVVGRDGSSLTITYDAGACDADIHTLVVDTASTIQLTVTANARTADPCEASLSRRTTVVKTSQPVGNRSIRDGYFREMISARR